MAEIFLTYPTPEGSREIVLERERTSFGRNSDAADFRIEDDGLSRLHASIYRDGDRVWIVDENSTNGTFVNGAKVGGSGTILKNGDQIKIGNQTKMNIRVGDAPTTQTSAPVDDVQSNSVAAPTSDAPSSSMLIPLAVTGFALLIIGVSAIFIGVKVFGGGKSDDVIVYKDNRGFDDSGDDSDDDDKNEKTAKTPKPEKSPVANTSSVNNSGGNSTNSPEALNDGTKIVLPVNKKYQAMSDDEKNKYIAFKAEKVARLIGNQKSDPIPPEAVQSIKKFVGEYAARLTKAKNDSCVPGKWTGSDFVTVLERASKTSPFVVRAFNAEAIEPQIGIYIAMIESEHCPCLESKTHAKGMFQFLASSAPDYGLNPDQRCEPEPSAKAAAKYVKSLMGRFGTSPDSVPLAIASYNSGQGNLSNNLEKVLGVAANEKRNFWTLVANQNKMQGNAAKQFSGENFRYVPKFFATAIIGENPQDFGVNLQPLSTYTK